MMDIYYESSEGVKLDLLKAPYRIQTGNIFDYRWNYSSRLSSIGRNKIQKFYKDLKEFSITLGVMGGSKEEYYKAINDFHNVVERDVINNTCGKLWVGDYYLNCYIVGSEKSEWEPDIEVMDNEITVIVENPSWCKEILFRYTKVPEAYLEEKERAEADEIIDNVTQTVKYPRIYPYEYTMSTGFQRPVSRPMMEFPFEFKKRHTVGKLQNPHFGDCDFKMLVYGPCVYPEITIGDNIYGIKEILTDGEYMVLDTRERTITRFSTNGLVRNVFNSQNKEHYIFEKIKSGMNIVQWNALYTFDVVLYQERSEPEWIL